MFGFIYAGLVWVTPRFQMEDGQFPFYYYALVVILYAIHQVLRYRKKFCLHLFFNFNFSRSLCIACLLL